MTFEELKAEASRQGYTLTKKITYEPLKKCVCGKYPQQEININPNGKYYYCKHCGRNCGRNGEIAKTNYQAISNWNKAVEQVKNIDGWKGE